MPGDVTKRIAFALLVLGLLAVAFYFGRNTGRSGNHADQGTSTRTHTGKHHGQGKHHGGAASSGELNRLLGKASAGQTITLAAKAYGDLKVSGHSFSAPVRIVGQAGTTVAGLHILQSRNLTFSGFRVTPSGTAPAKVAVHGSHDITFDHVVFAGIRETQGVQMDIDRAAAGISITNSEFSQCGEGKFCIRPGGTQITIAHDTFRDCIDCDFVHGGGHDVTITDSTFDRAEPGGVGSGHHNDLIQIMGGGPWTITGNRFGDRHGGAAQIFVNPGIHNTKNPIHGITISSNLFTFHRENMLFAVKIETGKKAGQAPPAQVRVVNNTILSGTLASVDLGPNYASVPASQRPIVANNVLAAVIKNLCDRGTLDHDLIVKGPSCGSSNLSGNPRLGADGRPLAGSPVIDAGDAAYAPKLDLLGHPRSGAPDIGAFEASK